ncbi:MFS transporter [Nocardioides panaciterrulae]|uniref:Putative MFS family arabinose efflux permease n=1 Tax=Nocardioides panaciterrulae TaxID=661492 RepID=A0A7Y9E6B0_9ACTN|nr:MFS transporter [Nocardioides panaciterrulae]NYD41656.1 putative MFS family arabinose efflux permease [Nocardioides panaciterrulae]
MTGGDEPPGDVFGHHDFTRFWVAETVSGFGSYVTTMALQVLVVLSLHGSAGDVGLLNAARWTPYLLLGLVVGSLVERRRRRPVLVVTDLARAVLLLSIPVLWMVDDLSLPTLLVVMVVFGTMSLLNDAASQSFLPRLVPGPSLLAANARLDQSSSVAQTSGPVVAGGLVTAIGAPAAVLVDAVSYLVSALATASIRTPEPTPVPDGTPRHLRREIGEGLRWIYRHRMLAPVVLSTHGWFLCNSIVTTVFVPFALLRLGLSPFELGVAFAAAGVGGLLGSSVSTRVGMRWGAGGTVIACRAVMPLAWAVIVIAPVQNHGHASVLALVLAGGGQFLIGLAMGVENANEMAYQQAITPDELQGRMNTTRRSLNRAMIVIGAPLGGLLADAVGYRPVMVVAIVGFTLVAGGLAASPFRHARHGDSQGLVGLQERLGGG